jgi:competence ComEA-like helix-hairpin-helix protein
MAWLESLAVKQGAAEEELLTTPEKRVEEPPEWVLESVSESEEEPEEEPDRKIEEIAAAAVAGAAVGALIGEEEDQEDEITTEEEAAIVSETSEWIPEATQDAEVIVEPAAEEIPPVLEVEPVITIEADDISPVEEVEPEVVQGVEGAVEPEEVEQEISADLVPTPDEDIAEIEKEEQPAEEIPEWLSGLTEDEEPIVETQPPEWSPAMLMEEESGAEGPEEAELVSKFDLNAASLAQLERIPGIGFIHAQRIVNYRTTSGPFKDMDELEKVPGLTPEMVDDLKDYLTVEVVVEAAPPISTIPELQEAWNSITDGEIDTAVDQYSQLIKSDQHLDEVIRDLQEALGKYPADASLYQSLGDAYMHANMLQEALDAYHRAEDLIK